MPDTHKNYELIPPEGDRNVGNTVFEILGIIVEEKARLGLKKMWNRNYEMRRNKHWKTQSAIGVPLVSANMVYAHIQRTSNTLTDNNPTFNVAQIGTTDEASKEWFADLQRCTEHWWQETEQQDKFETSVINGETYGICLEKMGFDPTAEYGLGDAETIIVDPFYFGWYPTTLKDISELQKSEAVVYFYLESVRTLRRKYPEMAEEIKPNKDILEALGDDRRDINANDSKKKTSNMLISMSNVVKNVINFLSGTGTTEDDETVICEMYVRDNTEVNGKLKYPGGIRYILACAPNIVLEDKPNPSINPNLSEEEARQTYLYDKFPFYGANSVKDTTSAWGCSDIEQIEWLNMELNKALSQFVLEKDRAARKKLINPKDSGVENGEFTNFPGIINPVNSQVSMGIRYLDTPPSSTDYDKAITIFKDLAFMTVGTFDLDQAQTQSNVIAYKAIAALLERAATMMRGKIRSYSRLIRERGRMYLSMVQNFYTEARWITYRDDEGRTSAKEITGSDMIIPAKLTVVTGSTLPISRVQQREEAITLYGSQAIDRQELLERIDWPNRNEVVKRIEAGPLGAIMDKLAMAGVPPQIMEFAQQIAGIDTKNLQKAIDSGEIPSFPQFMQQMMAEMQGQPPPEDAGKAGEQMKLQAEIKKMEAEAALSISKAQTEAVNQQVKIAGVQFDEDKMRLERAKAVSSMESEIKTHHREDFKIGADLVTKIVNEPGQGVQGIQSDNEQV